MERDTGSVNPYLAARREWDERYGDALARAHHWRLAAFAALALAAVAVFGLAYVGSLSKIKPYVVALDHLGDPLAMTQPVAGGAIAQRIIAAQVHPATGALGSGAAARTWWARDCISPGSWRTLY